MKNSILNLGKVLNKAEQKKVSGGVNFGGACVSDKECWLKIGTSDSECHFGYCRLTFIEL